MKRFLPVFLLTALFIIVCVLLVQTSSASADWRWASPHFKTKRVKPVCDSYQCFAAARVQTKRNRKARIKHYNLRKRNEWRMWTSLYIPDCTWYGESGYGPKYARVRYTMPNSMNSGALGKYQFMPGTYSANAKYGDWSPLDQEIAARREYWKHGVQPWSNCTG